MSLRWIWLAFLAAGLSGCAGVAPRGQAPAVPGCCASLAELPYQSLAAGSAQRVNIGPGSPTFAFAAGTSPVAAFRIPPAPRPLTLDLTSHQVAGPGLLENIYLSWALHRKGVVFHPTVIILDAQFRVTRSVASAGPTVSCIVNDVAGRGALITMHVPINEPPDESAYLVLATTDEQRSRTDFLCKDTPLVGGDVGDLTLTIHAPNVAGRRILLDTAAGWYPNRSQPSILSQVAMGFRDPLQGRLIVDDERLGYHQVEGNALVRKFDMPLARIALVSTAGPVGVTTLALGTVDEARTTLTWHSFVIAERPAVPDDRAADFANRLRDTIRRDTLVETIGFSVDPIAGDLAFQVLPADREADPALGRIGQSAVAGGVVTALPCGLCQTGACPPQMLAPCAAAFSVGALIGGAWAAGRELLTGGLKPASEPAPPPSPAPSQAAVATASRSRFDASTLQRCVMDALSAGDGAAWRDQGITARWRALPPGPGDAGRAGADAGADGLQSLAEIFVSTVALTARDDTRSGTPSAQASATLRIEGGVRISVPPGATAEITALKWSSDARTLAQWADADTEQIAADLDRGCRALAADAVLAAERRWRKHR